MQASISPGRPAAARSDGDTDDRPRRLDAVPTVVVGGAVVLALLVIYLLSNLDRENLYRHFIWQADAWLHGSFTIPYPAPGNDYYQDVMPVLGPGGTETGRGLLPFPPLPALALLPFVAIWGLATDAQLLTAIGAAIVAGAAFRMLGEIDIRRSTRIITTIFFGLGTVLWYAAAVGSTWWTAHVIALPLVIAAVAIGIHRERGVDVEPEGRLRRLVDPAIVVAGLLIGVAAAARMPVILGLGFFIFVGGGTVRRRLVSAAIGAAIPLALLVGYTFAATGHPFNPAYEYLYRVEVDGYPNLGYNGDWSIEDPRYIPQNLALILFMPPDVMPPCDPPDAPRGIFSADCPYLVPDAIGMSLLLTSPAWLLVIPAARRRRGDPLVSGGLTAMALIATLDLMHFSQGWVQYGYRFSLDWAPFALPLVAYGLDGLAGRGRRLGLLLIGLSILMQTWGILWRGVLGW